MLFVTELALRTQPQNTEEIKSFTGFRCGPSIGKSTSRRKMSFKATDYYATS